jgi:hypothetical protein
MYMHPNLPAGDRIGRVIEISAADDAYVVIALRVRMIGDPCRNPRIKAGSRGR